MSRSLAWKLVRKQLTELREQFIHVFASLAAHFEERAVVVAGEVLRGVSCHRALLVKIELVASQYYDTRGHVFLQFKVPGLQRTEALSICDVIHEYGRIGVAVIHGRKSAVALLACCIPHLELNLPLCDRQHFRQKRGTDCGLCSIEKCIAAEAQRNRSLSYSTFPEKHNLEVVLRRGVATARIIPIDLRILFRLFLITTAAHFAGNHDSKSKLQRVA